MTLLVLLLLRISLLFPLLSLRAEDWDNDDDDDDDAESREDRDEAKLLVADAVIALKMERARGVLSLSSAAAMMDVQSNSVRVVISAVWSSSIRRSMASAASVVAASFLKRVGKDASLDALVVALSGACSEVARVWRAGFRLCVILVLKGTTVDLCFLEMQHGC